MAFGSAVSVGTVGEEGGTSRWSDIQWSYIFQASLLIKQACYVSPAHPLVRHACLTAFIAFRMPLTPVSPN
eukprot:jgi/Botrbrau1/4335/Bobra.0232s0024.1